MSRLDSFDADAVLVQRLVLLKRVERRARAGAYLLTALTAAGAIAAGLVGWAWLF